MPTAVSIPPNDDSPRGLASLEQALVGSDMRNVSIVVFRVEDLSEIRTLYGRAGYHAAILGIQRALGRLAHRRGYGARTGPTEYTLVLPNMYPRETAALLAVQLGKPERFTFDADEEQIELVPEIAADVIAPGESIRECHSRVRAQAMHAIALEHARLAGMARLRDRLVRSGAKGLEDVRTGAPAQTRSTSRVPAATSPRSSLPAAAQSAAR